MKSAQLVVRSTLLLLLPLAAHGQNSTYTYEALPTPPVSIARDINNPGQIVGVTFFSGTPQAFLVDDGAVTLFTFPGALGSDAFGINDDGSIVGAYSLTGMDQHGYVRDPDGNFTTIDFPSPTNAGGQAIGINNKGDVVGFYFDLADFQLHGYVRFNDGEFQVIDHPNANGLTIALGINDNGVICGSYNDFNLGFPETAYTLENGVFTDFLPAGATSSNALKINNNGAFVGQFSPTELNPFEVDGPAYLQDQGGLKILEFPNVEDTDLWGLNQKRDVVGAFFPDELGPPFAFVARRGRSPRAR